MPPRSSPLEVAVLGLLGEQPLHGYELRTRLDLVIGGLRRRVSCGSLYPALRALRLRGLIAPVPEAACAGCGSRAAHRRRVVYALTESGERHLTSLLTASGPSTWEDDDFDVRFALFARTDAATRLAVLEGRCTRVRERLERARSHAAPRTSARRDGYLAELARRSTEQLERELAWLDRVVERERTAGAGPPDPPDRTTTETAGPVMPRAPRRTP